MRIVLVAHGFPPFERTGVENHVAELARELAEREHDVHVFVPRRDPRRAHLALRREARDGFTIHWLATNEPPRSSADHLEPEGVEAIFASFLEREAPDLVHVHHVHKLGIGILRATKARGLPLVFTAHDYAAVCHRTTMLRPDLARCTTVGDEALCARCDLAVAHLNAQKNLGDYQAGVFARDLPPKVAERVAQLLDGALRGKAATRALEERAELDRRRRQAFQLCDRVFAPTALVAERLLAGGVDASLVRVQPIAIDTAELAKLSRPRADAIGPLRFGFVGGLSKHKGLHVLLEAFRGVGPRAQLLVFGDTSDRPWLAKLRASAREVGAEWRGAFDASERAKVFASFDVLCVPSIWDENAPLVIREAFAAGRPVIASRIGALDRSVRDGIDGALVEPGDVASWRAALSNWTLDRAAFAKCASSVEPPRTIEDLAAELELSYVELVERSKVRSTVPAHLAPFAERWRDLEAEPFAVLALRVARGLERFAARVTPDRALAFPSLVAARNAPHLRDLARDDRAERDWLRRSIRGSEAAHEAARDARSQFAELRAAVERERLEFERAIAVLSTERDALALAKRVLETEVAWRKETQNALSADRDLARGELDAKARELAALVEHESALVRDLEATKQHERWLAGRAGELLGALGVANGADATAFGRSVDAARTKVAELERELAWRRREMLAAQSDGGSLVRAIVEKSALGERLRQWRAGEGSAR